MKHRMRTIGIVLAAALLWACAPSMIPAPTPGGDLNLSRNSLTLTKEGISITVFSSAWRYDPFELTDAFTTFLITVRNDTADTIQINPDSIFMYDERKTQYGIVTPEAADRALTSLYPTPPPIYYRGDVYHRWSWWGMGMSYGYPYERYTSDVIPLGYRLGPVNAGARTQGYIYLQKLSSSALNATLVIEALKSTGKIVTFTFPFTMQ